MCLAVYIDSESPLVKIPFDKKAPSFNAYPMKKKPRPLTRQYATELGAYSGCACGFMSERDTSWPEQHMGESEEARLSEESRRALVDYVLDAASHGPISVLFSWAGDERKEPLRRKVTSADALLEVDFDAVFDGQPVLYEVIARKTGP